MVVRHLRVPNLAGAMGALRDMGYELIGLDADGEAELAPALDAAAARPLALVLGAEGPIRSRSSFWKLA